MFIPCIINHKNNRNNLLLNKGCVIMCNSIKGSEIGIQTNILYDDLDVIDEYIPKDKEIISIQITPYAIDCDNKVWKWFLIITYKK